MAAGGFKEFIAGETLDEDEINDFLMQGVLVFAGTAARASAIPAPVEGQFSYLSDSNNVEFYDGSDWVELSTTPGAAVVGSTTGSPTVGTVASGGTTYNVYSFTGSGSITFSDPGFVELLVIGGGGAGGFGNGAGGGAGAHLEISEGYFLADTHTITVGAGGAVLPRGDNEGGTGNNGNSSLIGDFIAPGGGGGAGLTRDSAGGTYATHGLNGASGGGSSGFGTFGVARSGGLGLLPVGRNGGSSTSTTAGAGGGGASAVGGSISGSTGGAGGSGEASSITGSSVTRAGGGGGGGSTGGSAGTGGGGAGTSSGLAGSGLANTGGGGGGADTGTPGAGGSGIVIVRVAI